MKKWLVAVAVTAALGATAVQAKEWKDVRIAVDVPYEPFEYKAPDGTLTGFEVDLGNAVCENAKLNCSWVVQAWDGIIPGLKARKYDVIFSSMSVTPERAKQVLFSEPYYNTPSGYFAPKGTTINPSDASSLEGKRIGVQRGTIQDTHATDTFGKVAEVKRYTTGDDLVLDLQGGRLDIVLIDFPVGEASILGGKDGDTFTAVGENIQLGGGVGAAFRKRDKDLAGIFNESLAEVKANGTYDEIRKKYFAYDIKM
ncbi:transporter substrate-binding domain-containing protein [Enterovibrio nigricans]|uniref:Arginine/ornithine transport system substrate-binding protein n=1 Tax=Enterovibrio nigricans DSM 22720 TaxID=1121868 RepID=A0A1T4UMD2_9GAMM|nr:transporter substrate-binding domain-containing protein [Enterovibrio nigricans]PKF49853.1 nickel transporter [Enterovibrio nigricans]SKA53847.1 arginine/ornithine transport system substrate-binding protein [Enterovibrio nigricans DSM 22720]